MSIDDYHDPVDVAEAFDESFINFEAIDTLAGYTELEIAAHRCHCEVCRRTSLLCPAAVSAIELERREREP